MARQSKRNSNAKRVNEDRKARSKRGATTTRRRDTKGKSRPKRGSGSRSASERSKRRSSGGHVTSKGRRGAGSRSVGVGATTTDEVERSTMQVIDTVLVPSDLEESATGRANRTAESMVGDELPGGTVAVPDNDRVDEWASAFGVERSPDSPVRTSGEILDSRDRRRPGRRSAPKL